MAGGFSGNRRVCTVDARSWEAVTRLSVEVAPMPVIMSTIGPRETHDYRNHNPLIT